MTKLLTSILLLSFTFSFGQFNLKNNLKENEQIIKPKTYDGKKNINKDIIIENEIERIKYIGEEFSFAPKEVLDYFFYKPMIYIKHYNESENNSYDIDSISNNKFIVLNYLNEKEFKKVGATKIISSRDIVYDCPSTIIEIQPINRKDIKLYVESDIFRLSAISTKYQNHLEKTLLGNTFVHMYESAPKYQAKFYIIEKKESIQIKNNSEWVVTEIKYMETTQGSTKTMNLVVILNNPEYGSTYRVWVTDWEGFSKENKLYGSWFIPKDEYLIKIQKDQEAIKQNEIQLAKLESERNEAKQEIIRKYGARIGGLINSNKLELNMTEEMCLLSWGYPFEKKNIENESGVLTIWRYYNGYKVYFLNGKIKQFEY
uniref:hypothetical protein n=1 Tax=Gelidibacter sp. TaxID=2018083 RepID=UPI0040497CAB